MAAFEFIIVIFNHKQDAKLPVNLKFVQWAQSGIGDWHYKKERHGDGPGQQIHVHIARKKHIKTKKKQVSWNIDGTKHDAGSFYENINGMNSAKQIASEVLGIPVSTLRLITTISIPVHPYRFSTHEIVIFNMEEG